MTHSIASHVAALQAILDQAGDVDALLAAITRCEGRDVAEAAYNALCATLPGIKPTQPAYKRFGDEVGEWVGGMYRFYCYMAAWPISPAVAAGAVLA